MSNKFCFATFIQDLPRSGRSGLSLIEVVVAVAMLGALTAGMLGILWQGAIASERSRRVTAAYNVARGVMETYSDWATVGALSGSIQLAPVTLNGVPYTLSVLVQDGPVNPSALKQFTVTVTWSGGSVTVASLKANY